MEERRESAREREKDCRREGEGEEGRKERLKRERERNEK